MLKRGLGARAELREGLAGALGHKLAQVFDVTDAIDVIERCQDGASQGAGVKTKALRKSALRPVMRGTSISSASSMTSTSPLALVFLSNPDVIC